MGLFDGKSSNPMFNDSVLDNYDVAREEKMTIQGAINKTLILLGITTITAFVSWQKLLPLLAASPMAYVIGFGIVGVLMVLYAMRKPQHAHIVAPLYAMVEGLFIGAISGAYAYFFEGIVLQAALLTFGTLFGMLFLYKAGVIRATERFRKIMVVAIAGVGIAYLIGWIGYAFNFEVPFMHGNSPLAIGVSIAILVIAALTLVLDFDMIEKSAAQGAPKNYEWIGAMALLVTIVWLYLEFLRLLSKLQD